VVSKFLTPRVGVTATLKALGGAHGDRCVLERWETNLDTKTEKKLADLAAEFSTTGPGAVYAALRVLHQAYASGKHNEFATHCCAFQQIEGVTLTTSAPKPVEKTPGVIH
jgi:hypothetical protein